MTNPSNRLLWFILILVLSAYVVYEHATNCLAIDSAVQIERHEKMLAGESEFFNPWQYRVFSMWVLEGFITVYETLVSGRPAILPYLFLHYLQIVLIFYLSIWYFKLLGLHNYYLIAAGLIILCYSMANSYFKSDLSFNTYFDIAFYLMAAIAIIRGQYLWIIPLTVVAALNRETSGFIPLMLLAPFTMSGLKNTPRQKWLIAGVSLLLFVIVFASVRLYYGYQPGVGIKGMSSSKEFLIFNLTFFRLYPLLIGTLGIVPVIILFGLRELPPILRSWFWLIVPLWFVIHFTKSNAMETRLFLVPQVLIFVPALLLLITGNNTANREARFKTGEIKKGAV